MGPYIFIAASVAFALFMGYAMRALRRKRSAQAAREHGDPHPCPDGSFLPVMRTRSVFLRKEGERDYGMVVFDGLFCPACKREIICAACGGTPERGSVLGSEDERVGIIRCCQEPRYEMRRQGVVLFIDDYRMN